MTYFEVGSINICLCNSTLQHLHGSYLNFPSFQIKYFKDILKYSKLILKQTNMVLIILFSFALPMDWKVFPHIV
jgi:hypothetical protein